MGDLRAAVAQERKVVHMRVMQERVIVEKNAMADDGILAERAIFASQPIGVSPYRLTVS